MKIKDFLIRTKKENLFRRAFVDALDEALREKLGWGYYSCYHDHTNTLSICFSETYTSEIYSMEIKLDSEENLKIVMVEEGFPKESIPVVNYIIRSFNFKTKRKED